MDVNFSGFEFRGFCGVCVAAGGWRFEKWRVNETWWPWNTLLRILREAVLMLILIIWLIGIVLDQEARGF